MAGSGVEDGFDLEVQRDLVADDDAAGFEDCVEVDAEIAALDLAGGGEPCTGPAVWIGAEAAEFEVQRDGLGHASERELSVEDVAVAVRSNAGGSVGHHLVGVDVEEVG